jgi:anti-sigma factor RsiW
MANEQVGPLDCEEVRDLLYLFVTNELEPDENTAVCLHLAGCDPCRTVMSEHVQMATRLGAVVRNAEIRYYGHA